MYKQINKYIYIYIYTHIHIDMCLVSSMRRSCPNSVEAKGLRGTRVKGNPKERNVDACAIT